VKSKDKRNLFSSFPVQKQLRLPLLPLMIALEREEVKIYYEETLMDRSYSGWGKCYLFCY
jgi:hypothetical protein